MNPIMLPGEIQSTVADGNLVRNSKNRYLPENYHTQNKDEISSETGRVLGTR